MTTNPHHQPAASPVSLTLAEQKHWIQQAMQLASKALPHDVPVGALVLDAQGKVIATGYNRREQECDPTAHAEILVLRQAGQMLKNWRLNEATLCITLEPCPMCAAAIAQARVGRVIFGAWDSLMGAAGSVNDLLTPAGVDVVGGILEADCRMQLSQFFQHRRQT